MPTDASSVAISLNMQREQGGAAALEPPPNCKTRPSIFLVTGKSIESVAQALAPSTTSNRFSITARIGRLGFERRTRARRHEVRRHGLRKERNLSREIFVETVKLLGLPSQKVTRVSDAYVLCAVPRNGNSPGMAIALVLIR